MKISYNWLKALLPELTKTPEKVAELLTAHSFETTVAHRWKIDRCVRVVRIVKLEPHQNAQHLQLATVSDGHENVRVVCGADNIREGDIVPYAPPGAKVYSEEQELSAVREVVIRGERSPGMLTSPRELGLSGWHGGILLLPPETACGSALQEHIPADVILEADITPNRAHDCLSHRGIARELAALVDIPLQEPTQYPLPPAQERINDWTVVIEDNQRTPRYLGVLLKNLTVGVSPLWLQVRLYASGARPINNIVDITNYVMCELGNPVHAFDAGRLPGKTMGVRSAHARETLTTLDGTPHIFSGGERVITSNNVPVALAGIMGGVGSEVTSATKQVLLEVAHFNAYAIQQAATRCGITTEASLRFSKGLDPNLVAETAARTVELLQRLAGAQVEGVIDHYARPRKPLTITFEPRSIQQIIGMAIAPDTARNILQRLRCTITGTKTRWEITIPTDRLDIQGSHDIIEEIVRVEGLENIPAHLPDAPPQLVSLPAPRKWQEAIRDALIRFGMAEAYNYSFEDTQRAALLGIEGKPLELVNPIAPEFSNLRRSLIPGLVNVVLKNKGLVRTHYVFEIGHVFEKTDDAATRVPGIQEKTKVAGIVGGNRGVRKIVEDIVVSLLEQCGICGAYVMKKGDVTDGTVVFGTIRELTPDIQQAIKLALPTAMFELDLDELVRHATGEPQYNHVVSEQPVQFKSISKYPPVFRDISMRVDPTVRIDKAQEIIERVGGELVRDVDLFDVFQADERHGNKSIAFHIRYQAEDRTLTDQEINNVHQQITSALENELHAQIR